MTPEEVRFQLILSLLKFLSFDVDDILTLAVHYFELRVLIILIIVCQLGAFPVAKIKLPRPLTTTGIPIVSKVQINIPG